MISDLRLCCTVDFIGSDTPIDTEAGKFLRYEGKEKGWKSIVTG